MIAKTAAKDKNQPLDQAARLEKYQLAKKFYDILLKTEWFTPEKLSAYQEPIVKDLIRHATAHVPYYRDALKFLTGRNGEIDLARWLEVPIMRRGDVVDHYDALKSEMVPENHGRVHRASSSASHGRSLSVLKTDLHDTGLVCAAFRHGAAFDIDYSRNLAMVRALDPNMELEEGLDPERGKWGPQWTAPETRGDRFHLSVHTAPGKQLEWLADRSPCYLNTLPSNILSLAAHVRDHGGDVSGITAILSIGELVDGDIRAQAKKYLGCEIMDSFATAECGVLALQCPAGGGYHIQAEIAVVEVLKDNGEPCRPGDTGRVTATPLYNYAMPLMRYQTDDYVTVGDVCPCGRGLPLVSEIIGRRELLFRFADGARMRPEPDSDEIARYLGDRRWQIAQVAADKIEVRIAAARASKPADKQGMAAYVEKLLGRRIEVRCVDVPVLGPAAGGKFYRVVCELEEMT